jgi:hypothetical protein
LFMHPKVQVTCRTWGGEHLEELLRAGGGGEHLEELRRILGGGEHLENCVGPSAGGGGGGEH